MKTLGCLFLTAFIYSSNVPFLLSQNKSSFRVVIESQSKITINGTSNVNTFAFTQQGSLVKNPVHVSFTDSLLNDLLNPVCIQIEVEKFDCDNPLMKDDFFIALRSDVFPYLKITCSSIELSDDFDINAKQSSGFVYVCIFLAGNTCNYKVPFVLAHKNNKLIIFGKKEVRFSDFKLTPPSKLFGAIQVDEVLKININLVVSYTQI